MRLLITLFAFLLSAALYGQNDYSMSFDGVDDYVDVPTSVSLDNISTELTVSVWINPSHLSTNGTHPRIIDRAEGPGGVNDRWFLTWSPTGTVDFGIGSGANGCLGNSVTPLNSWTHVAATFNNGQIHIYVNGVIDASAMSLTTTLIHIQNCNLKIGSAPASSYFPGELDNAHIWNTALTQQEIQNYMNCPPSGNEEGLVGYWNFEEGSGTTAFDQTANGNDGTIHGATYSSDVPMPNTSYTDVTACDSYDWNGTTYSESGTYYYSDEGSDNYSMRFDGVDDWVALPASAVNNLNYGTYMTWVKLVDNTNETLLVKHSDAENTYSSFSIGSAVLSNGHGALADPGRVYFHSRNQIPNASSLGIVNTGVYTHIAISFNQTSVSFYINGQYSGTTNGDYSITDDLTVSSVWLGRFVYSGCMDGVMDDFSIWNQNLTQQEIQNYMSCPPTGNEEGLVGYWNFEEGSGTTAFDQTANGNDGTINGATYDTNVSLQSCGLTNANGCDSTAVLNLTLLPCSGEEVSTFCGEGTVWDSESQECIVANPTDTNFDGCTDLNDLLDILSAYGDCAVSEFTCGDDIEHEGYNYSTVQIGDQCWFSENCRYLPEVSPSSEGSETEPYYYVYGYEGTDIEAAKSTDNYETYGVLYNWPAAITEGLCPSNWHVPSDLEWQIMEISLGMSEADAASEAWRGSPVGDYMKSTSGWNSNGNGSNSSGFTALPSGYNNYDFGTIGVYCTWWSSGLNSNSLAAIRSLYYSYGEVLRGFYPLHPGYSVRCIKD